MSEVPNVCQFVIVDDYWCKFILININVYLNCVMENLEAGGCRCVKVHNAVAQE